MKKTPDKVVLNDVYHTIKSPIVSIQSLLFVIKRNKVVQSNVVLQDKLSQIEEKVSLLHKRSEIFLNYILYREGVVEFLYSFFDLDEVIDGVIKKLPSHAVRFSISKSGKQPIMGDQGQLQESFRIIFADLQSVCKEETVPVTITHAGKKIDIVVRCKKESNKKVQDKDEQNVARQELYVAGRIIELHGGSLNYSPSGEYMNVKISLPVKAKAYTRRK